MDPLDLILYWIKTKVMNLSPVLGLAKLIVKSRKTKLILIGIQLGYVGYKYLKNRKDRPSKSILKISKKHTDWSILFCLFLGDVFCDFLTKCVYRNVSEKHLDAYAVKLEFRYNTMDICGVDRFKYIYVGHERIPHFW